MFTYEITFLPATIPSPEGVLPACPHGCWVRPCTLPDVTPTLTAPLQIVYIKDHIMRGVTKPADALLS